MLPQMISRQSFDSHLVRVSFTVIVYIEFDHPTLDQDQLNTFEVLGKNFKWHFFDI